MIILEHLTHSRHGVTFLERVVLGLESTEVGPDHVVPGPPTDSALGNYVMVVCTLVGLLVAGRLDVEIGFFEGVRFPPEQRVV